MTDNGLYQLCENVIDEAWSGHTMEKPSIRGVAPPVETNMGLSYKGQRIGGPEHNLARMSDASGNNPYEQEEGFGSITKTEVFEMIDMLLSELDEHNHQDKVAMMVLGKLKKMIS